MIKVLVLEIGKEPYVKEIENTLEAKQELVGGWIEVSCPPIHDDSAVIICNEEGKLRHLPLNRPLRMQDGTIYDVIVGNCFVIDAPIESEDFEGLSEEQIEKYTKMYALS